MKDIRNWVKIVLVIGLIVVLNRSNMLIIQIRPYKHDIEYSIFPFAFNILLFFLIGISCGWIIKSYAEKVAQYTAMAAIMLLIVLLPMLYFMTPLTWIPGFVVVFQKEYKMETLVFGIFSMLAIKSQIAHVKAKKNAV